MNISNETNTLKISSKPLPDGSPDKFLSSTILDAWFVVFLVEAVLIIALNLNTIVLLKRGHFDRVRYFAVSFAFIDIMRGCVAVVVVLGLVHSDGHDCRMDFQKLHLALQTFCDVFSMCFLAAISCDMYYRIFWPLTHRRTRVRCYMSVNFAIWLISMALTMCFAFGLAGFYELLIADLLVWCFEVLNLAIICATYILVWQEITSEKHFQLWRIQKRNFTYAKAFSLCAFVYIVIWLPVEVLEGISHFTQELPFPCNSLLYMKFLKIFCSLVSPVIYIKKLSQFHNACGCSSIIGREKTKYLPDSLALITLQSASHLMRGI